jgi:hypothetical protein
LHFKKVGKNVWSVRISGGCRALALKQGHDYYWIWIGSHNELGPPMLGDVASGFPSLGDQGPKPDATA